MRTGATGLSGSTGQTFVESPRVQPRYLRMIQRMKSRGKREWSVYVLRCGDGSLYTGIAKNVTARLAQHTCGKGAAYTRTHLPVQLVYQENNFTRSKALIREAALKRLPRHKKESILLVSSPATRSPSSPAVTGGGSPDKIEAVRFPASGRGE